MQRYAPHMYTFFERERHRRNGTAACAPGALSALLTPRVRPSTLGNTRCGPSAVGFSWRLGMPPRLANASEGVEWRPQ